MGSRRKKGLRDKKLLYGVKQFNVEPNRGIRVLIDAGFLQPENPKDVARFLFSEGRLSKKQVVIFVTFISHSMNLFIDSLLRRSENSLAAMRSLTRRFCASLFDATNSSISSWYKL